MTKRTDFKVGDWVVFDLKIGQIMQTHPYEEFSDGSFNTSGRLLGRCRPLTLRSKVIVESFDYYYNELRKIDGEAGFNYPDISSHFAQLALDAIDSSDQEAAQFYDRAREFVREARDYHLTIQGVNLFRRKIA